MALPTSPSVVVIENNNSIFAPNVNSSVVGIVGFADKGPVNEAILVTSQNDLLNKFGKPNSLIPGQGLEGAIEILEATNQVYFVRADNGSAMPASAIVPIGFAPHVQVSSTSLPGPIQLTYSITDGYGVFQTSALVTVTPNTGETISDTFKRYFDKSLINDAPLVADQDSAGNLFLASRYAGSSSRLTVSAPLTFRMYNYQSSAFTDGANVTASGGTAVTTGASSLYAYFETNDTGIGYNLKTLRDGSIEGVSVEVDSKSILDYVSLNTDGLLAENFLVNLAPSSENYLGFTLSTDLSLNKSRIANAVVMSNLDAFVTQSNVADILPSVKAFVYNGSTTQFRPRFIKLIEGTYAMSGGDSGYSADEQGSQNDIAGLIGSQTYKTGLYALDDDSLNVSLALVPGITNQSVQNALTTLAESSKNFMAIIAPPLGLDTVQEAVNWINGRETRTAAVNSSYVAVAWPWVQVFNYFSEADEWYDPSIFLARQCVYTDNVSEPWFAPAGFRRGRLTKPSDTEVRLNQGDKDALYENNINPISKENQFGITILGQKTSDRLPSALQSINVRRLLIYIRKVLLVLGKPFQFEPNDEFTWELVEDAIQPFLSDLIARRAITEGAVKCDSTTNTGLRRDRKELWCSVTIKPTLAAETVVFEVNITNQSATING